MSEPWDVERQWLHDLAVAEGVESMQDAEVAEWREEQNVEYDLDGDYELIAGSEEHDVPAKSSNPDVPAGSDAESLLELIKDVTGRSMTAWIDDCATSDNLQAWHVPAWLAEDNGIPLHDPDLGTIIVGYPHYETDDAVKFDRGVDVLALHRRRRVEHESCRRTMVDWREWYVTAVAEWESAVHACVGDDESFAWDWSFEMMQRTYWPFSQMTRIH